jgi:serine/threonine protein kinase
VDGATGFAMKRVARWHLSDTVTELAILCSFKHPNIVGCLFTPTLSASAIEMVLPRADCNLRTWIRVNHGTHANPARNLRWASQLCQALGALHAQYILHADIKTSNVLVHGDNLKLCDFSMAIQKSEPDSTYSHIATTITHRPLEAFLAQEMVAGFSWAEPQDVWALGCVLYEMTYGQRLFPFQTTRSADGSDPTCIIASIRALLAWRDADPVTGMPTTLVRAAEAHVRDRTPQTFLRPAIVPAYRTEVPHINNLIRRMLCLEPGRRITMTDALRLSVLRDQALVQPVFYVTRQTELDPACATACDRQALPTPARNLLRKVQGLEGVMGVPERLRACRLLGALLTGEDMPVPATEDIQNMEKILLHLGFRILQCREVRTTPSVSA